MSDGIKSNFQRLATLVTAGTAALLAACASPITRPPELDKSKVDEAAERQIAARRSKQVEQAPNSPYINFPVIQRLANVNQRVSIAAAPFCVESNQPTKTTYAISVGALDGDNGRPVVMDNGAKIQPGSRLLEVNGRTISGGIGGRNQFLDASDASARQNQPLDIKVQQGNQVISAKLNPVTACNYPLKYHTASTPMGKVFNAFADGTNVHLTETLVKALPNDADIGFVLAHEYGHNFYKHMDAKKSNMSWAGALGMIVDIGAATQGINTKGAATKAAAAMGAGAYSVDFEKEADYAGLYVLKRAGYELIAGQRVADRMALLGKESAVKYSTTHPATADRAAAAERTEAEIEHKHSHGLPVTPNLKSGPK